MGARLTSGRHPDGRIYLVAYAGRHSICVSTVAVVPALNGLAVHALGRSRVVPWDVAKELLDDPDLTVHTASAGGLSPWDTERLLCAIAAGEPDAIAITARSEMDVRRVRELERHPRLWARTIDLSIISGDLEGACCRAGYPLPNGDPLIEVASVARLMERHAGHLEVRQRLLADHPWIGDAAWLSATGQLAETIILEGLRRDQIQRPVQAGGMRVRDLLARPERFQASHPQVLAAMLSILDGDVRWDERGHLTLLPAAENLFRVGSAAIALGVGGLHTCDRPEAVVGPLVDLDVASYYPSIIALDGISPPQLPDFSRRVGILMDRRLQAKRRGDHTASRALKFVINSLYGQLGNARSGLFSPPDALRVVLTGQLRLLQLVDRLLVHGCDLTSANTDGVVVRGYVEAAASSWESETGFILEQNVYQNIWRTSVNDYIATDREGVLVRAKGRFAGGVEDSDSETSRRSAASIIARAAVAHLVQGRPIGEVIAEAGAVTDFTMWRRARDLTWGGTPVTATVVRWVVGRAGLPIVKSIANRDTATLASHAIPVIDPALIDMSVIDRTWYVSETHDLVDQVLGTSHGTKQLSLL